MSVEFFNEFRLVYAKAIRSFSQRSFYWRSKSGPSFGNMTQTQLNSGSVGNGIEVLPLPLIFLMLRLERSVVPIKAEKGLALEYPSPQPASGPKPLDDRPRVQANISGICVDGPGPFRSQKTRVHKTCIRL